MGWTLRLRGPKGTPAQLVVQLATLQHICMDAG
jgi:hypothetical protein